MKSPHVPSLQVEPGTASASSGGAAASDLSQRMACSPRQQAQQEQLAQLRPAAGGLPGPLRAGIESLSGLDMSGVRVHRNSAKPATLQAHAYAQGSDIHLAPGQDKHLPHEAWHVVQQRQGRVKPTTQLAQGQAINDDQRLEREADGMGQKALALGGQPDAGGTAQRQASEVAQRATEIRYAPQQNFGHGAFAMGAYAANTPVGSGFMAKLDRNDPVRGSATGGGALAALAPAMAALNAGPFVARNWRQGHLLNSDAGGLAVDSNLVPITQEANTYHEGLVERGVKVNLHNANTAARLLDANDPGYDVWYRVAAIPKNLGGNPYGANNPDVDLVTSWRYWRAGQNMWSQYRLDRIKSESGPAAYAHDPNWAHAGTRLGVGGGVQRRVVPVAHMAVVGLGVAVPANMTYAIIDAVIDGGGAIAAANRVISWHDGMPAA